MDKIAVYTFPIRKADDIAKLRFYLSESKVFIPGFDANKSNIYNPVVYLDEHTHHNVSTILVVDRNIISHWINLAKGNSVTNEGRIACAVMAFAKYADMAIEPNMALYELGSTQGNKAANDDLRWFRAAEGIDTLDWVDLALSRTHSLQPALVTLPTIHEVDFEMPLYRWRRNYILCLKLAELELQNRNSERRFQEFLRWTYKDYLMGAAATVLAAYYLAPNASRRGLLKGIRSANRDKAVEGVKNATWDVTLVTEWAHNSQESAIRNSIQLLATMDRRLYILAQYMLDFPDNGTSDRRKEMLETFWGKEIGGRLCKQVQEYDQSRDNLERRVNQQYSEDFIDNLINQGEERLRSWKP